MGGEQALKLVAAVKEPAEVTGEGDEKGDDDDPRKLQGKFQVTAGDHDHHATDDEENEMAEHHSAGFAVGLNEDVELGGGGWRTGHQVIVRRRSRFELSARAGLG